MSAESPTPQSPNALALADTSAIHVLHTSTFGNALSQLRDRGASALLVVDGDARLRGIFTAHDALQGDPTRDRDRTVTELMSEPVLKLTADAPRRAVLAALLHTGFGHLPVVDESERVLGMVSATSVLREEVERLRGELESLESFLTADGPGG